MSAEIIKEIEKEWGKVRFYNRPRILISIFFKPIKSIIKFPMSFVINKFCLIMGATFYLFLLGKLAVAADYCAVVNKPEGIIERFIFCKCQTKAECLEYIDTTKDEHTKSYILEYHPDFLNQVDLGEPHHYIIEKCSANNLRESLGIPLKDYAGEDIKLVPIIEYLEEVKNVWPKIYKKKCNVKCEDLSSCEQAYKYLKCNPSLDSDNDGIPCEGNLCEDPNKPK